ncbi:MAG: TIGR00730 family Rossman fold protein [Paludibacteraceae bacterium]|nr:TIGR00730 family Rossman fold protein [Paludibacteraceae bacterium]
MKVAVYCSAKDVIPEEYLALGDALGTWLGEHGHTLVYGGATGGLMSRVSNAARKAGAHVIGVIPPRIKAAGRLATNCHELIEVAHMSERKQRMRELADCFVCLPGSYGTLDEMLDVLASGTVGEHRKPLYVLNYLGFYDHLKLLAEHMRTLHFLPQEEHYVPIYANSLEELYQMIH